MNKYSLIKELQEFFNDSLPSLEELEKMRDSGKEISLNELGTDIANYVHSIKCRLDNPYSSSIKAFLTSDGSVLLAGYDDRTRQESNYALIKGRDVFCYAGNARKDGHLNEFINNTDGYIPNSVYHLENVSYLTDNIGRVCCTYERHITERQTDRNESRGELKSIALQKGGKDGDVGGHIVAHSIDGPTEAINILPMDEEFNNSGDWKDMEKLFLDEYQHHRSFDVRRKITYQNQTQIPINIDVDAIIQGEYKYWPFELQKNT